MFDWLIYGVFYGLWSILITLPFNLLWAIVKAYSWIILELPEVLVNGTKDVPGAISFYWTFAILAATTFFIIFLYKVVQAHRKNFDKRYGKIFLDSVKAFAYLFIFPFLIGLIHTFSKIAMNIFGISWDADHNIANSLFEVLKPTTISPADWKFLADPKNHFLPPYSGMFWSWKEKIMSYGPTMLLVGLGLGIPLILNMKTLMSKIIKFFTLILFAPAVTVTVISDGGIKMKSLLKNYLFNYISLLFYFLAFFIAILVIQLSASLLNNGPESINNMLVKPLILFGISYGVGSTIPKMWSMFDNAVLKSTEPKSQGVETTNQPQEKPATLTGIAKKTIPGAGTLDKLKKGK